MQGKAREHAGSQAARLASLEYGTQVQASHLKVRKTRSCLAYQVQVKGRVYIVMQREYDLL